MSKAENVNATIGRFNCVSVAFQLRFEAFYIVIIILIKYLGLFGVEIRSRK